jgi:hypothetical protein
MNLMWHLEKIDWESFHWVAINGNTLHLTCLSSVLWAEFWGSENLKEKVAATEHTVFFFFFSLK